MYYYAMILLLLVELHTFCNSVLLSLNIILSILLSHPPQPMNYKYIMHSNLASLGRAQIEMSLKFIDSPR